MTGELSVKQAGTATAEAPREPLQGATFTPRVDILEDDNELLLLADLPGVNPGQLDLRFENGELVLHGRCTPRQDGIQYLMEEYAVGDFHRVFAISADINADQITAEVKNGVLSLHLPKSEKVKPRRIAVKSE